MTWNGGRVKAGSAIGTMALLAVASLAFAFAVMGCAGPQEQERAGAAGGDDAYSRDEFPHWASAAETYGWTEPDGSCDVRDSALIRDGEGVRIDGDCSIAAGTWLDPYTGRMLTDSSVVDIDHVVPLANAWRSGASSAEWSTVDREAYANDPEVLLSADAGANRAKGDKGPEAWQPPNGDYHCEYARRWVNIKSDWRLTVNPAEKTALNEMLATCKAG